MAVIVDIGDFDCILAEITEKDGLTQATRRALAAKAYARTAAYDAAISAYLLADASLDSTSHRAVGGALRQGLRYGENPHQRAAFFVASTKRPGVATARQLQGKELSYNNLNDTDAAYELVGEFDPKEARRSRSSSMPIPAASRKGARWKRPISGRLPAIRSRPSAASSPSTGGSMQLRRGAWSRSSPR